MLALTRIIIPWLRQGPLNRPATLQAEQKRGSVYTKLFRPCTDALSLSVPSKHSVITTIAGVSFCCNPANVARLVVLVCIDSIELVALAGMLTYLRSYLLSKCGVFMPLVKHLYTSSAVVFERVVPWAIAAMLHARPSGVKVRSDFAVMLVFAPSLAHECKRGLLA